MSTQPIRIAPDESEIKRVNQLYRMLINEGSAALVGPDNTKIELPKTVFDVLVKVVENMQEGKAIAVLPEKEEVSTQAAADILGISRQFFVRECESGKIPFHFTGTHRRIALKDVLDYMKKREEVRRAAIVRIAHDAEDAGDYGEFINPEE